MWTWHGAEAGQQQVRQASAPAFSKPKAHLNTTCTSCSSSLLLGPGLELDCAAGLLVPALLAPPPLLAASAASLSAGAEGKVSFTKPNAAAKPMPDTTKCFLAACAARARADMAPAPEASKASSASVAGSRRRSKRRRQTG